MSAYYEVDEKFIIRDYVSLNDEFKNILFFHLTALACDSISALRASSFQMTVKTDGLTYSICEDSTVKECRYVLSVIGKSSELSVFTHYTGRLEDFGRTPYSTYKEWVSYLKNADEDFLSDIYCAFYTTDDSETDIGTLEAYGKNDGFLYRGEIPFAPVPSVPEGLWSFPHTALSFHYDGSSQAAPKLESLINRLSALRCHDELASSQGENIYSLWALRLTDVSLLDEYISCISNISALLGRSDFIGEKVLYDRGKKLRLLKIITEGTELKGFQIAEA